MCLLGDTRGADGLLERHLAAKEEIWWPALLASDLPALEIQQEAAADHHEIRGAIGETRLQPSGSPQWWRAVTDALSATLEYIDRQERNLARWRYQADPTDRDKLGRQWAVFITAQGAGPSQSPNGHDVM